MKEKIGLIGTGNMGSALVKGMIKSGAVKPEQVYIFDKDAAKASELKERLGIITARSGRETVELADIVILAVKPNIVKPVLEDIKDAFGCSRILVSVAAGLPISAYKDVLGHDKKIVRVMPNTPALVGEGMTLISCGEEVSDAEAAVVKEIFETVGKAELLEERLMSEVIALTGSSPAYVFMFIEAMADAAVLSGIPRNTAYRLASQAVLGSAKMVLETGKHPGELKDQVCSPAGTTIEAVASLEKNGFRFAVMDAMNECTKKAREIGKLYGK